MNAEERREARRRRILENSDSRLKKITRLTVNENVSNGNKQDEHGNNLIFDCLELILTFIHKYININNII